MTDTDTSPEPVDATIDRNALLPVSRFNRASGDFEVVEGIFEVPGRSDLLVIQTPDGRFWQCRRTCPHQGADLAVTGRLGPEPRTITCSRHRDQGPFDFRALGARPLERSSNWLTPVAGTTPPDRGQAAGQDAGWLSRWWPPWPDGLEWAGPFAPTPTAPAKPACVGTTAPPTAARSARPGEVKCVHEVRWHELTKDECFQLLADQRLGRLVLVDDRGPIALPVNFVFDEHNVLFRTDEGTKLDVAGRGARVAFEIDGVDAATRTGWSVLVRGEATEVTDPSELERVRQLPLYPWAPGAKDRYIRILPTAVTGRRITLADAPWNWLG